MIRDALARNARERAGAIHITISKVPDHRLGPSDKVKNVEDRGPSLQQEPEQLDIIRDSSWSRRKPFEKCESRSEVGGCGAKPLPGLKQKPNQSLKHKSASALR